MMANPLESHRVEHPPRESPFHRPPRLARRLAVPSLLHNRLILREGSRLGHHSRRLIPRAGRRWTATGLLVDAALTFVAVVTGIAAMARRERRSFGDYGLPLRDHCASLFAQGVLWGFAGSTFVLLTIG
jgi:hypothetical protein